MPTEVDPEHDLLVRAYHTTFGSPDGQIVLADLVKFCRAADSTFDPAPTVHARNEGKRDVWLRIAYLSSLLPSQVIGLNARNLEMLSNHVERLRDENYRLRHGEDDG